MSRGYYRKRSEATEQERVINWARFYAKDFPELDLLHHIPNGGSRNQLEAANLKRQGVKAGVPDLCLPVARNGKHGLYVEMKWGKNKTTDKQDWWLEQLRQQGYETAVCWTAEEAMDTIAGYLGIIEQTGRKGGRVNGSNGPHIETDSAILQHHEACRGVRTAPEAAEAAEENDADGIQPERAESHIKTARHSQSSCKEAV